MRTLRLIFTCFLSLAILSVGSAAVAMSVHSPCAMQQMQENHTSVMMDQSAMMSMDMGHQPDMSDMDCQKVEKSQASHNSMCMSGQDCVMYNVQLAYPASLVIAAQLKQQYLVAQQITLQPHPFFPTPDLFGLWRPPSAL